MQSLVIIERDQVGEMPLLIARPQSGGPFPLIVALLNGPQRFKDLQQSLKVITPKVLSKELRDLELNDFVFRKVYDTVPVMITYELTAYSSTLNPIIDSLRDWGVKHKQRIVEVRKLEISMEG